MAIYTLGWYILAAFIALVGLPLEIAAALDRRRDTETATDVIRRLRGPILGWRWLLFAAVFTWAGGHLLLDVW